MRIHHLNCGCMCPIGGALFDGFSRGLTARLICHCLLVETEQGLVLIDTGFGERDVKAPRSRLSPFFMNLNRIQFEQKYTALAAVEQLGYAARDVRHIVLTHLDFDHAGGLEDFPEATVHVMQAEIDAANERRGFIARACAIVPVNGMKSNTGSTIRQGASLGSALRQCATSTDYLRIFSSSRSQVTREVMLALPSRHRRVGSYMRAMPTFIGTKWEPLTHAAHRVCVPTNG